MRQHRSENDLHLGQRFIAESEQRILGQKQTIKRMRRKGQPTEQAEAVLKGFEASLLQLRKQHPLAFFETSQLMNVGGCPDPLGRGRRVWLKRIRAGAMPTI